MLPGLFKGLRDLFYPKTCLACRKKLRQQEAQDFICSFCWDKIEKNLPPFCVSCGRKLDKFIYSKNLCSGCRKKRLKFDRAFSPCAYNGVIKELIHEFKYKKKDYLSKPLGQIMSDFIKEYNLPMRDFDLIVPVPLHKLRLREREFNQAQLLAEHLGNTFQKEVRPDILRRHRLTKTQTELDLKLRFENMRDSFSINHPQGACDRNILLIDDVLTTGATASEAAGALKSAGARIVFVLTLAS